MFHPNPLCLLSTCLPAALNSCIVDRMVSAHVTTAVSPPLLQELGMRGAGSSQMDRERRSQGGGGRWVSRPAEEALGDQQWNGKERSVSIMLEIKGRLVPPAALLFRSGPVSGRGRRRSASMRMQERHLLIFVLLLYTKNT